MAVHGATVAKGRAGASAQRPARRDRPAHAQPRAKRGSWRKVLPFVPLIAKVTLAIVAGVLVFAGYRAVATASFFQLRAVDVNGTSHTSAEDVRAVASRVVARTGVWDADLSALSAELKRLPWVRSAIVSRVLPDGLRVRITERAPLAIFRTSSGQLAWVDDEGVRLGLKAPSDQIPDFLIRGLDEAESDAARAENRERMQRYAEMSREWRQSGLSERVSEVNLMDLRDVRAQLAGDDAQIEVRLGNHDFGSRLKRALKVLDEQRNTPRGPFITRLDVTQDTRTVIGFNSGAQSLDSTGSASTQTPAGGAQTDVSATQPGAKPAARANETRSDSAKKSKKNDRNDNKKSKNVADESRPATRPRRAG
ncbi:MAG: hypothetical protein AUG51_10765 [Acidobacteria bacterium 13_1_20CM_3_53_8]|nr:MAG: hypothetical protein AUG51_10765 [Acidobacteria bacterium 13_1_20CM_3_53_8]